MLLAFIAYGENAVSDLAFYQAIGSSQEPIQSTSLDSMQIHGIDECQVPKEPPESSPGQQGKDQSDRADNRALCARIDSMAQCIKKRLVEDSAFKQSVVKFSATFETLSAKHTNSHLTSAFHKFGWCFGGYISRLQGGTLRRGRRIAIQAKSAGRRKKTVSRGKGKVMAGRKPLQARDMNVETNERYFLPIRKVNNSIKRPHSLSRNCQNGQQNGGKW